MKKIIYAIIICLSFNFSFGQDVPFDKKIFKENKTEFKEAIKHIEKGDEYLGFTPLRLIGILSPNEKRGLNFAGALEEYLIAYAFNAKSADLNYKIGICYDNIDKYKMEKYIFGAYKLKPTVVPEIRYYMGVCHHLNGDWQKAISEYNAFGSLANNDLMHVKIAATKKIMECRSGEKISKTNARVWIDNVGGSINTKYPDYAPVISADEALMIFTARRPDEEMSPSGGYFEDLYSSKRKNGEWSNSRALGRSVNVLGQHDATIGLSPDGHILFVYNDKKGHGDILISTSENGEWTKPIRLGKNINTKDYHEPDASLSFDGRVLYFTSNKPGGFGGHDIYRSVWDEEKKIWGVGINLGGIINSAYDERSVFIHPDGTTMYFSSTGHNTIGGYDLFYSKLKDGVWQEPINFGTPLNTPHDDLQLVVAGNGRYGYYSSYRADGYGEKDIYLITFLGPEKSPLLSNEDNLIASIAEPVKEQLIEPEVISEGANMAILIGVVRDEKTKEPLKSNIVLIDNEENKIIAEFKSDAVTGKYLVSLPGGKNYGIAVKKEGYLFHSDNFVIPNESGFRQYEKNVDLKKIEIGKKIVLRNIFFDLSKWSLRNESVNELERLIKLMNENPTMKIELSGHTDTRGAQEANRVLSENRAKSVVEYLVDHGIDKSRLKFSGYGEEQPIHSDSKIYEEKSREKREELHQENRRTEFKVISL